MRALVWPVFIIACHAEPSKETPAPTASSAAATTVPAAPATTAPAAPATTPFVDPDPGYSSGCASGLTKCGWGPSYACCNAKQRCCTAGGRGYFCNDSLAACPARD